MGTRLSEGWPWQQAAEAALRLCAGTGARADKAAPRSSGAPRAHSIAAQAKVRRRRALRHDEQHTPHPTPHAMHVDDLIRHETPASEPDCMCGSEIAQYLAMVSPQGGSCPVTLSTAASRARPTRHTPAKTLRSYSRNVTNKCPICVIPGGISPTPAKVESAGIRAALGYGSGACGYDSL